MGTSQTPPPGTGSDLQLKSFLQQEWLRISSYQTEVGFEYLVDVW